MRNDIHKEAITSIIQAYCTKEEYRLVEKQIIASLNYRSFHELHNLFETKTPFGLIWELCDTSILDKSEGFPNTLVIRYQNDKVPYSNLYWEYKDKLKELHER